MLSTNETYANDVSEFFNVITGHSQPSAYRNLITSPRDMRIQLINLVQREAEVLRLPAAEGSNAGLLGWRALAASEDQLDRKSVV
mgnify:CR=1 FL=1